MNDDYYFEKHPLYPRRVRTMKEIKADFNKMQSKFYGRKKNR